MDIPINPYHEGTSPSNAWKAGFSAGQKDATENNRGHARQNLFEQFILFMQDAGYESAVMSLSQMQKLRTELDELMSNASDTKYQAQVLSDRLADIEVY